MRHSPDHLTDMFYWPAMDLFIWGITGLYLAQYTPNSANYLGIILSGLIFGVVIWRSHYEIASNLLQELWDRNIVNLFTTPLSTLEWMSSFLVYGFLKTMVSLTFSATLAFFLYHYTAYSFGANLILFVINLLFTGWTMGFIISGLIVRFGQRVQTLAWTGLALISPFSAMYYPLSILPHWAQNIAHFIPSSYTFEAIRQSLFTHTTAYDKLFISFGLNILYFIFAIWFFVRMFNKSRKLGLGRLI